MLTIRSLLKQPRFFVVASLTLAMGVGAVTTIFSVINGVLLKPLPYANSDRLVNVWSHAPKLGYDQFPLSPDVFLAYERDNQAFESMALFSRRRANLTGDATPEVVEAINVTHTYFDTLGVTMARGRTFSTKEDSPDGPFVVVLSHRAWRLRYGGQEDIVGRVIRLDGQPTEVVGVASAVIDTKGSPDFYQPSRLNRAAPIQGNFGFNVIARLKPGVSAEDAASNLKPVVQKLLDRASSPTYRAFLTDGGYTPQVILMKEDLVGDLRRPLWILLGTVGLLLLVACANVANLFLVRAEGRHREIAVRIALGASRVRLIRQLMSEAVLLSLFGSALGVAAAAAGLPALIGAAPPSIPRLDQVTMDWRVVVFAAGAAMVSAVLFGLWPALRYTRAGVLASISHGGRAETDDPGRRRTRNVLVILQTAMALVLLVGSGLLGRSFAKLVSTDLGFNPRDVMTFRVTLPSADYRDAAAVRQFVGSLTSRLRELPGVESAGAVSHLPIAYNSPGTAHEFEGRALQSDRLPPMVHYKTIDVGYFESMRMPVRIGRDFNSGDMTADGRALIANQALVDLYWPGQNPIGKRVRLSSAGAAQTPPWFTVVGVVGDERSDGLRRPIRPLFYYPLVDAGAGQGVRVFDFVVRGNALSARTETLRQTVWGLDKSLPVAQMRSMDQIVESSIVEFTFTMLTLGLAAVLALLLGGIGLYGVLSYAVTLRTREIGVRLALGAPRSRVMRSVVLSGVGIASIGLVIGLAGAAGLSRLLGNLLFETEAIDPPTFAAMSAALFVVAILASYLPARRAASVSPLESMKDG